MSTPETGSSSIRRSGWGGWRRPAAPAAARRPTVGPPACPAGRRRRSGKNGIPGPVTAFLPAGEKGRIPGGEGQGHIQHGGGGALVHVQGLGHIADAGGARGAGRPSWPLNSTVPVWRISPRMALSRVDLPAPLRPMTAVMLAAVGVEADVVLQQGGRRPG